MKRIIQKLRKLSKKQTNHPNGKEISQILKVGSDRIEAEGFPGIYYKYFALKPLVLNTQLPDDPGCARFIPHLGTVKTYLEWKDLGIDLTTEQSFRFKKKRMKVTFQFLPVPDEQIAVPRKKANVEASHLQKELNAVGRTLVLQH